MMAVYKDTCRNCGVDFENSHVQNLNYCSVGCQVATHTWKEFCEHRHNPDDCVKCAKGVKEGEK